ncbi:MAG: CPBP family intramembrane glutamic endopeptidase [Anaerolineae bacterium]
MFASSSEGGVRWHQVRIFLGMTFALTWGLNLLLWQTVGYGASQPAVMMLQLQMLLPALSAILCVLFLFRDHPLFQARQRGERGCWVFYLFIAYTLVHTASTLIALFSYDFIVLNINAIVSQAVGLAALLAVLVIRLVLGKEAFARVGLAGGRPRYWLIFGAGFAAFYGLQTVLNMLFHLGQVVDIAALVGGGVQLPAPLLWFIAALQAVVLGPFLGLLFAFGEEFGWRGYLQSELLRLGKVRAMLVIGVIWGIWHAPVIAMGHNYPGYPAAGILLMTAYCIGLAVILGYAVLKSGSVWLAAFLHAVNNQAASFFLAAVYRPNHPIFSFGAGLYGVLCVWLAAVLIILLDPIWREGAGG